MSEPVVTGQPNGAVSDAEPDQTTALLAALAADARPADEVFAKWRADPEMRAELEARDAVRRYGVVKVLVRNAIVQGPVMRSKAAWMRSGGAGFVEEFDNLDEARLFAEGHKWFFNNCRIQVEYLVRYHTRTEQVPAYGGSWTAPMVDRDVTYAVWRDVPGFETGEPDRFCQHHTRQAARRTTRYVVLGGPGGRMAMVRAASPELTGRYDDWLRLTGLRVHGPVDYARLDRIYAAVRSAWGLT